MSPLPSPTPFRRTILRLLFSPMGLMCGFVVLLIATCPGARGDDAISMLVASGGLPAAADGERSAVAALAAVGRPDGSRSAGVEQAPRSAARSATPRERGLGTPIRVRDEEVFPHSRAALPLLLAPLPGAAGPSPSAAIAPMTGPAVGVPRTSPAAQR